MAYITFNDGTAAQLDNGLRLVAGGAGSRFSNWVPMTMPVGPTRANLATGAITQFKFRTDFGAAFELRDIPLNMVSVADRLRAHLLGGGTCAVYTEDATARTYATCGLMPDATPELTMQDAGGFLFTMSLALINLATSPVQMRCEY
jgi:hypothetical protein